jgi:hypothetical protein
MGTATSPDRQSAHPRVFVSYAHGDDLHNERVARLVESLKKQGFDAYFDRHGEADAGWPTWMIEQITAADFVIVVCSDSYHDRFEGKARKGLGRGVKWEGLIIKQLLYESEGVNRKFIPVCFQEDQLQYVPMILRPYTHFVLSDGPGFEALYRALTGQPEIHQSSVGAPALRPLFELSPMPGPAVDAWPARLLTVEYVNVVRLSGLLAGAGMQSNLLPHLPVSKTLHELGPALVAVMVYTREALAKVRPAARPLDDVKDWSNALGTLVSITDAPFRTKNVPPPDAGEFRFTGVLEKDPQAYLDRPGWRFVMPLDPRWITTTSAFSLLRGHPARTRLSGLGLVREVDDRRQRVLASPIVLGLPRNDFHDAMDRALNETQTSMDDQTGTDGPFWA